MSFVRYSWPLTLLLLLAIGCSDKPAAKNQGPIVIRVGHDTSHLSVEDLSGHITLRRGDDTLLSLDATGFSLGVVTALEDTLNYDPWPMISGDLLYHDPESLAWLTLSQALVQESTDHSAILALTWSDGTTASLTIDASHPDRFRLHLVPDHSAERAVAFIRLQVGVDESEAFYGLGEYFDQVNHRGKQRAMQLELQAGVESGYNEAHVPVPFVTGTTGWGLFVESHRPAAFDVAHDDPALVAATFGTAHDSDKGLVVHLFAADHPLDITQHYYAVTSPPLLPAPWGLGPWVWRDENQSQQEVLDDIQILRDLDLATTGIWIDRPYATAVNSFDFKATQFPDPAAMIEQIHALGLRLALWHTPYVEPDKEGSAALRAEAETQGYFPPLAGFLFKWGPPIDLTNPDAYAWWQDLIQIYIDMGVEGFKLDYGEDIVVGLAGFRTPWLFHDGSDDLTQHSRYQALYHQVYAEMLPETGGFLLARSGTFGDQAYTSVIWPGDLDATMARHGDKMTKADGTTYFSVGGLPAAVVAGMSLGPSGYPFFASDTGGYRNAPPDKEIFTRWFQHTALSTVMQIGTNTNDVAWELGGPNGFDEEMLGWYRRYTRLHLRLFPYLWSHAQRLAVDGRPIVRALGLAYPELGVHPNDTYLLGDGLLVAPVVDYGARERTLQLPPGAWLDYWTDAVYEGPQSITVDAPLDTLPLFVRAGAIIPLLRPTIDAIAPTTQPELVDSLATTAGVLHPVVILGADGTFTLYDASALTLTHEETESTLVWEPGSVFVHGVAPEIRGLTQAPASVMDNDQAVPLSNAAQSRMPPVGEAHWDSEHKRLIVHLGPGKHTLRVQPGGP
jgi:alpha-D-xyloside xylohydrolase